MASVDGSLRLSRGAGQSNRLAHLPVESEMLRVRRGISGGQFFGHLLSKPKNFHQTGSRQFERFYTATSAELRR
jgi:hypothetical protein